MSSTTRQTSPISASSSMCCSRLSIRSAASRPILDWSNAMRGSLRVGRLYAIAYARMEAATPLGPRVRALREGMDLSLRDLAERSGVSAPMLSQVERGETSPTLAVAGRIAAGLDLRLSQLLRLDQQGSVSVVRAAARPRGGSQGSGPPFRTPTPP